jgi:methylenetetrahydrofolate reductase (NADPH)
VELCRNASIEMTVHETSALAEVAALLPAGSLVFLSRLPKQTWQETIDGAAAIRAAGLEAVPHVPVRALESEAELRWLVESLADAQVKHLLLIAGDVPHPAGAYAASIDVMRSGVLEKHGITRVCVAGHPEGHPRVGEADLRAAELQKFRHAREAGLTLTFVTQFAFDAEPIMRWVAELRSRGIDAAVRAGLAGPAKLTTLLKYAVRCGVGASLRALGERASGFGRLMSEDGPEPLIRKLACADPQIRTALAGIHLFSFGGMLKTCRWLRAVQEGRIKLDDGAGFHVVESTDTA